MGNRFDEAKVSILVNRIVDSAIPIHLENLNKHAESIKKVILDQNRGSLIFLKALRR